MKLSYYSLFVLFVVVLASCRKDKNDIDIKEYDDQQIQAYIAANGLTNMKKATDTTGIYYEILTQGNSGTFSYPDTLSYVFTVKSLNGSYQSIDTIVNHAHGYAGQIPPNGLMLAMINLVKTRGTRAHVLIPSHLAYGINGTGTGSTRLQGNQSLDFYINVLGSDHSAYDDLSIQKYMAANTLSGFTTVTIASGPYAGAKYYYKVRKIGTGTTVINENSSVVVDFRGQLLNGTIFEPSNYSAETTATEQTFDLSDPAVSLIPGFRQALLRAGVEGTDITIIMPSILGYGVNSSGSIPANSCLYFDMTIGAVTNP